MYFFKWKFDTHICWCCGCLTISEKCLRLIQLNTPCIFYDRRRRECNTSAMIAKEKYGNCKGKVKNEEER